MAQRGLAINQNYPVCNQAVETTLYSLRDCPRANDVLSMFCHGKNLLNFFTADLKQWNTKNLSMHRQPGIEADWGFQFGAIIWVLWYQHNDFVFNNKLFTSQQIARLILHRINEFQSSNYDNQLQVTMRSSYQQQFIGWIYPREDWVKYNLDGALKGQGTLAACDGVFRDSSGRWMLGFSNLLGNTTIMMTELRGILLAQNIARQ
ncbi:Ribonuclease H-like superfamily [Sesbania bispinosa]|nr:Ribonuclease H-like superfamily [Sesbania bispinosa]